MAMMNTFAPVAAQVPTSNTDAVATLTAPTDPSVSWIMAGISWSYSAAPTGGKLTIVWVVGSTTYTETYFIIAGGPGIITFPALRYFPPATQVVITLTAGGSGITGNVYPSAWTS